MTFGSKRQPVDRGDAPHVPPRPPGRAAADDYGIRNGFAIVFKKRELPARADLGP